MDKCDLTEREAHAIRELMNIMRTDIGTVSKALVAMNERGFTAEETQTAVNEIAKRVS
jgi:5-bromo-4-chloroindolyl phosphate hydrolysis protein